jgi:hypothetical protein
MRLAENMLSDTRHIPIHIVEECIKSLGEMFLLWYTLCMEKVIRARFYQNAKGNEPVREWLLTMDAASRHRIGEDIRTVELGWPVGMPVCRPLGNGLFEVRTSLKDSIARIFFLHKER